MLELQSNIKAAMNVNVNTGMLRTLGNEPQTFWLRVEPLATPQLPIMVNIIGNNAKQHTYNPITFC